MLMLSAENSAETFRTNGIPITPTGKLQEGPRDISLEQTSEAFGFADRVKGLLHAGNFTFRGNLAEPDRVTASLWSELTDLTWRDRTAEAIMLGAALYNRKIAAPATLYPTKKQPVHFERRRCITGKLVGMAQAGFSRKHFRIDRSVG